MEYFEAPQSIRTSRPSVFLAGGVTGCPDWQHDATRAFADMDVAVLNPRRQDFPIYDPQAGRVQISWEFYAMRAASVILFWFPDSGAIVQPIALYELGRYGALGKRMVLGRDPAYVRRQDIDIQTALAFPQLRVHDTLETTVAAARAMLAMAGG